jgi:hypothetical protein
LPISSSTRSTGPDHQPDEFAEKDPEWIARLLGIKHTLGGDSIESLNLAMNDPANIIMMPRKEGRHARLSVPLKALKPRPATLAVNQRTIGRLTVAGTDSQHRR